jgi:hypothetical protein
MAFNTVSKLLFWFFGCFLLLLLLFLVLINFFFCEKKFDVESVRLQLSNALAKELAKEQQCGDRQS